MQTARRLKTRELNEPGNCWTSKPPAVSFRCFLMRALLKRKHMMICSLAVVGALTLAVLIAGCASAAAGNETAAPVTFRVMTYNIQHGAGADDVIDLNRTAAAINQEKPDI